MLHVQHDDWNNFSRQKSILFILNAVLLNVL